MSHWHYQLMRHQHIHQDGGVEEYYGIHEYYVTEDGDFYTEGPIVTGETPEEVKDTLRCMENDIYRYGVKDYNYKKDVSYEG